MSCWGQIITQEIYAGALKSSRRNVAVSICSLFSSSIALSKAIALALSWRRGIPCAKPTHVGRDIAKQIREGCAGPEISMRRASSARGM